MTTTPSGNASGSLHSLLESVRVLGPAKLAAMGLVTVGMLCMLALLMLRGGGGEKSMALLYADLDLREAGQMTDLLDKAHIDHQVNSQGDQIMVPTAEVASARLLLAKSNLPSGGSVGYEIFDRGDSLTSTQFQQEINQTRALEGELVRSITLIQGVRGARVHLVLPHRDLFVQEAQSAQASVLLTLRGATRLDPEAVQAILNLVSAAVPGLKPQAVAIIDNHGNVLARNGASLGEAASAASFDEIRQGMELRLSHVVEEMLDASLGPDKVRAEATVTLDDAEISETQESYNPDQQVLRSQQTTADKSRNTEAQQNTSVQNNLPNADAGRAQTGSQEEKRSETSNYEIGKTVRTLSQATPRIQRVSLAVLVADETVVTADGKRIYRRRDPAELARMAALVKSAIGFDPKRGDTVTVDSMRFDDDNDAGQIPVSKGLPGLAFAQGDLVRLGQTGMIGLTTLIVGLFVFRPIINRLASGDHVEPSRAIDEGRPSAIGAQLLDPGRLLAPPESGLQKPPDGRRPELALVSQHEIGKATNITARRLGELVEQFPEESLTLIRAWLSDGVS